MDGRCARCWSPKNLVNHEVDASPRADPTVRREKVLLCKHCGDSAPLDALLFWEVYMRFGSTRELLQHYGAESEELALQKLCMERGLNEREVLRRARGQQSAEALNNASRHGGAKSCLVSLAVRGGVLVVEVIDDGRGLTEVFRSGVGLVSMRERAAELNGTCTVQNASWGGTIVRAHLPLGDGRIPGDLGTQVP